MSAQDSQSIQRYLSEALSPAERLETLMPVQPEICEIFLACRPGAYSASEIARAVEDCDTELLTLCVTSMRDEADRPVVFLRARAANADSLSRSLARYGYDTLYAQSPSQLPDDTALARARELLLYLENF